MNTSLTLSELEYDALKEMMNISFGRAAASLSEIMDVNVILSVPVIQMVGVKGMAAFISTQAPETIAYSMVEQFFLGNFSGVSVLLLPESGGSNLISLFNPRPLQNMRSEERELLTRETILEIGNILIGACVGMLSELMENHVTFRPPQYQSGSVEALALENHIGSAGEVALIFKTIFHFDQQNVQGNLFLITSNESLFWIKSSIDHFMADIT